MKLIQGEKTPPKNAQVKIKISLIGSRPLVWRRIIVPARMHLGKLHKVLQITMGWQTSHLHEFVIEGDRYTDPSFDDFAIGPDDKTLDQGKITVAQVATRTQKFEYIYDFGDGWRHQIEIEEVGTPDPRLILPICIGGENACPPEDCGGLGGYANLLTNLRSEKPWNPEDPDDSDLLAWVGGYFDPFSFDPNRINRDHLWSKKW